MVHALVNSRVAILAAQIIKPVLKTGLIRLAAQVCPVTLAHKFSVVCRTALGIEQRWKLMNPERTRGMNAPLACACVIVVDACGAGPCNVARPMVESAFIRFSTV